jgi:putative transcriptional regulator
LSAVERVLTTPTETEAFRAYAGYSGWGPGQLEQEMKTGSWMTLPADPAIVFQKESGRIWPDMLRSFGASYEIYAEMPVDPNLN